MNNARIAERTDRRLGAPCDHDVGVTGALATWKVDDSLSLIGAYVNGWDAFDRVDDEGMGIGGFTWTNGDNLTVGYMYGYSVDEPTTYGATTPRNIIRAGPDSIRRQRSLGPDFSIR